jgi:plasmid maintenance system antidote protein VapI
MSAIAGAIGLALSEAQSVLSTVISKISEFIRYLIDITKDIAMRMFEAMQQHPFEFMMGMINFILYFG